MDLELANKGIASRQSEGNECKCLGGIHGNEHNILIKNVNLSFLKDSERFKSAPTSETMRAKVLSHRNGHK